MTQFTATSLTQFFIQDGQRFDIPTPKYDGVPNSSQITQEFCDNIFNVFTEHDRYTEVGGWPAMVDALSVPHVLVMSIWADVSLLLFSSLVANADAA